MSKAVDKLLEGNQKVAEKHRIAYGKEMYNQAIDDAIEAVKKMEWSWPWSDDQDGELIISKEDTISQLQQLKKHQP